VEDQTPVVGRWLGADRHSQAPPASGLDKQMRILQPIAQTELNDAGQITKRAGLRFVFSPFPVADKKFAAGRVIKLMLCVVSLCH